MSNDNKLKPCPFCGGADIEHRQNGVWCKNGNCEGGIDFGHFFGATDEDKEICLNETAKAWNRRASPWISVEEQLPEEGVEVLVVVRYASSLNLHTDELMINEVGEPEWLQYAWECVTHWMPPPELPEVPDDEL